MTYFIVFILLLFTSGLFINGWFLVTRGREEVQPDNSIKRVGKVFMGWYFFWTKEKDTKKIYYQGKQLNCIVEQMRQHTKEEINLHGEARIVVMPSFKRDKLKLQTILEVCIDIEENEGGPYYATIYKEEPEYVFPEWIRDMMAECVTCHASFYGNIIFWTFVALCREYSLGNMGIWNDLSGNALITTWLAYWVSLAYVNTWVYQKLKHF